jgi:predicted nucleic acid-binding OB-fold protein
MQKIQIKEGDSVVFSQRYLPQEPYAELHYRKGKVVQLCADNDFALVEFQYKPGHPRKVYIEDLEFAPADYSEDQEYPVLDEYDSNNTDTVPYDLVESIEDHELGGMNRAQLIAHKLLSQEYDPELDKNIAQMLR